MQTIKLETFGIKPEPPNPLRAVNVEEIQEPINTLEKEKIVSECLLA